jgi:hypothetical protein
MFLLLLLGLRRDSSKWDEGLEACAGAFEGAQAWQRPAALSAAPPRSSQLGARSALELEFDRRE